MNERIDTPIANLLATGAPGVLHLGDATYQVSQPTEADMVSVAFEVFKGLRRRRDRERLEYVKAVAGAGAEAIKAIMAEFKQEDAEDTSAQNLLRMNPVDFMEGLQDPDGCAMLAWVLIRKSHPEVSLASVRAQVTERNVAQVLLELLTESRLGELRKN